jgi:hypothetical protein
MRGSLVCSSQYYTKVCSVNLCFAYKIFSVRTDTRVQTFAFSKYKPLLFLYKIFYATLGAYAGRVQQKFYLTSVRT